jgi:hypothetical protein
MCVITFRRASASAHQQLAMMSAADSITISGDRPKFGEDDQVDSIAAVAPLSLPLSSIYLSIYLSIYITLVSLSVTLFTR